MARHQHDPRIKRLDLCGPWRRLRCGHARRARVRAAAAAGCRDAGAAAARRAPARRPARPGARGGGWAGAARRRRAAAPRHHRAARGRPAPAGLGAAPGARPAPPGGGRAGGRLRPRPGRVGRPRLHRVPAARQPGRGAAPGPDPARARPRRGAGEGLPGGRGGRGARRRGRGWAGPAARPARGQPGAHRPPDRGEAPGRGRRAAARRRAGRPARRRAPRTPRLRGGRGAAPAARGDQHPVAHGAATRRAAQPARRGALADVGVRRVALPAGAQGLPGARPGAGRRRRGHRPASVRRLAALGELGRRRPRRQPDGDRRGDQGHPRHPRRPPAARARGGHPQDRPLAHRRRLHHAAVAGAERLPRRGRGRPAGRGRRHPQALARRAAPPEAPARRRAAGRYPGRPCPLGALARCSEPVPGQRRRPGRGQRLPRSRRVPRRPPAGAGLAGGGGRAMAELQERHGPAACRRYVVSFTRAAADLAAVRALARLAVPDGSLALEVVPLFESRADLQAATTVLDEYLALPGVAAELDGRGRRLEVMLGYSDSAKDAGFLAANLALYRAQGALAAWARDNHVELVLFHGRGGALGRGGGPANRAVRGQAPGSVAGRFKVTDQGEVIFARYGNPAIGHRHLEQVTNAVLLASTPAAEAALRRAGQRFAEPAERMAAASEEAYRALVAQPGFAEFFGLVTPIDEISRLPLGSRPARRDAGGAGAMDLAALRAIPWVFAWGQTRCNLPGWYGLGSGLEAVAGQPDGLELLRAMHAEWPFFASLLENAEMSLAKADPMIAELYLDLGGRPELKAMIAEEYRRTRALVLAVGGGTHLLDRRPILRRAVALRNPYVDALSFIQVRALAALRAGSPDARRMAELVLLTAGGVAAGLQNTG